MPDCDAPSSAQSEKVEPSKAVDDGVVASVDDDPSYESQRPATITTKKHNLQSAVGDTTTTKETPGVETDRASRKRRIEKVTGDSPPRRSSRTATAVRSAASQAKEAGSSAAAPAARKDGIPDIHLPASSSQPKAKPSPVKKPSRTCEWFCQLGN